MNDGSNLFSALDQILAETWQAPAGPLAATLGLIDNRRITGGSDRIDLSATGQSWLVLSGAVDVFFADNHARPAFMRIEAGALIDSFDCTDGGPSPIGIPAPNTEIITTSRSALLAAPAQADTAAQLQTLWEQWFVALAHIGNLRAPAVSVATAEASRTLIAVPALAAAWAKQNRDAERQHAERIASERAAGQDFARGLGGLVDLISVRTTGDVGDADASLKSAAERVLRAMGRSDVSLRIDSEYSAAPTLALEEVARDNGVRYRAVNLHDDWWQHDLGPLCATSGENDQPCALIWAGKAYRLCIGDRSQIVDAAMAATIGKAAYSFYLPFPAGKLSARQILAFGLRGGRGDIIAIGFTLLLAGLFSLVIPIATGWLMDPIVPDAERGQVAVIAALLLLLAIGTTSVSIAQSLATLRLEAMADNHVQAAVWIRLLNLRLPFFRDFTAGDLASRADGINAIRKLVSQSLSTFAASGIAMLFSLALLIYYEWRLALAALIISAIFSAIVYAVGRRVLHYNFRTLEQAGKLQGTVFQLLGSIAKLRVAGAERQAFLRWLAPYRESVDLSLRQRVLNNRIHILHAGFAPFLTLAILIVLSLHSGDLTAFFRSVNQPAPYTPLMSVPNFVSFNIALGQFIGAVLGLTHAALSLVMVQPYYHRVQPILDAQQEPTGPAGRIGQLTGDIELRDVRFRYADTAPLALRGVSMHIPAGKFVAIVGPSGAGKTSIARLLLGFETPESGEIFIDGTEIRLLNPQDLRRHYGVALQNGMTFAGSIYDNIATGLPLSVDEVQEALRIAVLDELVNALPMGLHTNMAEGGGTFSGGQRQRLLIARAVARRPRVLIMDEATSALDNIVQRQVIENLRKIECTQVVIAQRLSTITSADLIYVIDQGQVVESGTYLELLENGPLFRSLAQRQMA